MNVNGGLIAISENAIVPISMVPTNKKYARNGIEHPTLGVRFRSGKATGYETHVSFVADRALA